MKSINEDPRDKQGQDKEISPSKESDANDDSASEDERRHRARNYKNGDDDIEGPDFDKYSEGADGDTSVNAGIFK